MLVFNDIIYKQRLSKESSKQSQSPQKVVRLALKRNILHDRPLFYSLGGYYLIENHRTQANMAEETVSRDPHLVQELLYATDVSC